MITQFALTNGTIDIDVTRADWPIDELCDFAARDNPRRGFLVVSKVLGRHIPVAPSVMRRSFTDLAAKLPGDLPGPVLIIGLAETAICLGQGVHENYVVATGRSDVTYLHSTRQHIDAPLLATFEEPHSHASGHLLYRPADFAAPRSLVLVDDEISTGTTLVNLAAALVDAVPEIEQIVVLTLTDWSGNTNWLARMPRPAGVDSLLSGHLRWTPGNAVALDADAGFDTKAKAMGHMAMHHNFGRLGRRDIATDGDWIAATLGLPPASRVRVIGTGEFTYPSFRLAEQLERGGHDVVVQSTTRSPAPIGGAIAHALRCNDNYATGVANFIYNVDPADQRLTLICHETGADSVDRQFVTALSARTLFFGP